MPRRNEKQRLCNFFGEEGGGGGGGVGGGEKIRCIMGDGQVVYMDIT